jgi:phosphohistidine phosphatase SixA
VGGAELQKGARHRLYLADLDKLLDAIAKQDAGCNSIVLIGHNLTELANYLLPDVTDNIPAYGLVALTIETDDWNLRAKSPVELILYDYPKRPA